MTTTMSERASAPRPLRQGRAPIPLTLPWAAGAPPWAIHRLNRVVRASKPESHRKHWP